jgi:hypothetical protein
VDAAAERIYELTVLGFHPEHRVPVTAKLSRKFYEQLGDDVAGELVDWFNAVDLTYQTQLREINNLNWERFKATLQAEMAAMRADLLKWMFIYWSGSVVAVGGLITGLRMFGPR